jgi:Holliday junction DNA helicase RuvB
MAIKRSPQKIKEDVHLEDDKNPNKRLSNDSTLKDDKDYYESLRPSKFDEIIGREKEKKTLRIMVDAAQKKDRTVDHILFYGPPGLGKTTFAMALSSEIGGNLYVTSGPAIDKQGDLAAILTGLSPNDVLFIDEIHRLSRTVEEILYPAMEDGVLDIVMGKGTSAKTVRINLEPFTLVGATTQIGKISSPMRDRFGLVQRLDYFETDDLEKIVERAARLDNLNLDNVALKEIANRSRGTGRVALRIYRRVRDFHESHEIEGDLITEDAVNQAVELLGIDSLGLEKVDREILQVMYQHFDGGPVGLNTLAAAVSEDISTLSDVYEPYLMKCGMIKRTSRGRMLTASGVSYISDII